jgi:hypothetical protein
LLGWHELDGGPFIIGGFMAQDSNLQFGVESVASGNPTAPGQAQQPLAFWGAADIRWLAKTIDSVENDPYRPTLSLHPDRLAEAEPR